MSVSSNFQSYRPVLSAESSEGRLSPPLHHEKRKITTVACLSCQKKRCRCDGKRPQCSTCLVIGPMALCVYETRGNQSRAEALKETNRALQEENTRLKELLHTGEPRRSGIEAPPEAQEAKNAIQGESSYTSSTSSGEKTAQGTSISPSVFANSDLVLRMQAQGVGLVETLPSAEVYNSELTGHPVDADFYLPSTPTFDQNELLQMKVAHLETEVKLLKEAIWHYPSYNNLNVAKSYLASADQTLSQGNPWTIDPSCIAIEAQSEQSDGSSHLGSYNFPIPVPPFSDYSVSPGLSDATTLVDLPTSFTPNSNIAFSTLTPYVDLLSLCPLISAALTKERINMNVLMQCRTIGQKRRRTSKRNIQPYVHKRRNYGSIMTFFGNLPVSSAILANFQPLPVQGAQIKSLEMPSHLVQILNSEDHSLPSNGNVLSPEFASIAFHKFRRHGRYLLANNVHSDDVVGPNEIDMNHLFMSEPCHSNHHTVSTFAPCFLQAYPSMSLPSKVACAILIQGLLRWQISPTIEHFNALPEWLKATGCQIFVPHISAFDFIPWPEIRDLLIAEGKLPEKQVLIMITSNFVISWPDTEAAMFTWDYEPATATGLSPRFIAHVYDIENWAINAKVLELYPFLEGKARFVDIHTELEQTATQSERRHREDPHL